MYNLIHWTTPDMWVFLEGSMRRHVKAWGTPSSVEVRPHTTNTILTQKPLGSLVTMGSWRSLLSLCPLYSIGSPISIVSIGSLISIGSLWFGSIVELVSLVSVCSQVSFIWLRCPCYLLKLNLFSHQKASQNHISTPITVHLRRIEAGLKESRRKVFTDSFWQ